MPLFARPEFGGLRDNRQHFTCEHPDGFTIGFAIHEREYPNLQYTLEVLDRIIQGEPAICVWVPPRHSLAETADVTMEQFVTEPVESFYYRAHLLLAVDDGHRNSSVPSPVITAEGNENLLRYLSRINRIVYDQLKIIPGQSAIDIFGGELSEYDFLEISRVLKGIGSRSIRAVFNHDWCIPFETFEELVGEYPPLPQHSDPESYWEYLAQRGLL